MNGASKKDRRPVPAPAFERVRQVFDYDKDSGIVSRKKVWRSRSGPCGTDNGDGHLRVTLDGNHYMLHKIIWLWMTGEWPSEVDHADLDGSNNKWGNLRLSTRSQNMANTGLRSSNTSGVKGVSWDKRSGKWLAKITKNYKQIPLGYFSTIDEAAAAYRGAAEQAFGTFARTPQ